MSKYIEFESLNRNSFYEVAGGEGFIIPEGLYECESDGAVISEPLQFADVRPVVRGYWMGKGEDVVCSECRCHPLRDMDMDTVYYWSYKPNYCPNCGAAMKENCK